MSFVCLDQPDPRPCYALPPFAVSSGAESGYAAYIQGKAVGVNEAYSKDAETLLSRAVRAFEFQAACLDCKD